jgi:dienelactone hydrolase
VLVWGNGACSTQGTSNTALLQNIASYGFIAIAEGAPSGGGTSNAQTMAAAINWAAKTAGTGSWTAMDASKIMAAGFSCGGVEAEDNLQNANVKTVGVISSGLQSNTGAAKNFKKPVLFVIGGSGDVAYQNVGCSFHAGSSRRPSC